MWRKKETYLYKSYNHKSANAKIRGNLHFLVEGFLIRKQLYRKRFGTCVVVGPCRNIIQPLLFKKETHNILKLSSASYKP
jgi:hypothetical protein